jgi:hypothetical protein
VIHYRRCGVLHALPLIGGCVRTGAAFRLTQLPLNCFGYQMGPVVNLRTERKRAKKRAAEQEAAAKRTAFGRSKAEANLERARRDKAQTSLDQHRMETGDLE